MKPGDGLGTALSTNAVRQSYFIFYRSPVASNFRQWRLRRESTFNPRQYAIRQLKHSLGSSPCNAILDDTSIVLLHMRNFRIRTTIQQVMMPQENIRALNSTQVGMG